MLVVSSSVGVLHGVHAHTTHGGPGVALGAVLVEGPAGLHDGLVGTAAAGDDTCPEGEERSASGSHSIRPQNSRQRAAALPLPDTPIIRKQASVYEHEHNI